MVASTSPGLRLLHMRDEIENLSHELAGPGFETYRESYGLRPITERAIQIVSEAARALPKKLRARYPDALWADITSIGNPLRHEYHRIDDRGFMGNRHRRFAQAAPRHLAHDRGVRGLRQRRLTLLTPT